jgi:hypothetical protein
MTVSTSGGDAVLPHRQNYVQFAVIAASNLQGITPLAAARYPETVHNWELHIMAVM